MTRLRSACGDGALHPGRAPKGARVVCCIRIGDVLSRAYEVHEIRDLRSAAVVDELTRDRNVAAPELLRDAESVGERSIPVHAEIRSSDPDATREFFAKLFGWDYSEPSSPGYTIVASGAEHGPPTAISPLQGADDQVLSFVGVEDAAAALSKAEALGGSLVQPAQQAPGVSWGVFADPQGHQIGVAAQT